MALILSGIFIFIAAFFNSVMDVIETQVAFNASRFRKLNKNFWCKPDSAKATGFIKFTHYHPDAWHFSKSMMIVCICAAIICYRVFVHPLADLVILGITWNISFDIFYNFLKPKNGKLKP